MVKIVDQRLNFKVQFFLGFVPIFRGGLSLQVIHLALECLLLQVIVRQPELFFEILIVFFHGIDYFVVGAFLLLVDEVLVAKR